MKKIIAKIVNTHGLKGQLKLLPAVDDEILFKNLKNFAIQDFDGVFECEKIVKSGNLFLLKILGLDDINLVEKFKNHNILIEQEDVKLNKDQYLVSDLIGCEISFDGKILGTICDVQNYGAGDVLFYKNKKVENSVPFVDYFFDKIDIENKVLYVNEKFFEGVV